MNKQFWYVATGGGGNKKEWEIHKFGCADVKRAIARRSINAATKVEAASPEEIIKSDLESELREMGFDENDFAIMPCCKDAI